MNSPKDTDRFQTPCRFLRNKEMYYQADGLAEDGFASGLFWCQKTQENVGPDRKPAGKAECCPGRSCFAG